jgi:hypothetical protein
MSLHPQAAYPIPEDTQRVARAAFPGLNPTSALLGAISAAGAAQMKANCSFSFIIAHYRLVQRPQKSSPSALGIPSDERDVQRPLSFLRP